VAGIKGIASHSIASTSTQLLSYAVPNSPESTLFNIKIEGSVGELLN